DGEREIMIKFEIIRILDDTSFIINAGTNKDIESGYFIDVLKRDKSYNYIAKVEEVYPELSLCKRYGEQRLFYGDIVRVRYPDEYDITTKVIKSNTTKKRRKKRG
ncbi:hypothetical protein, partial [Mammaliicoccus vitulinus]|uniref:hypothetical protein n=1 Tax=Mammaliicoccus vitulinus TaxID=71237 RepID=UPI003F97E562